MTYNVFSGTLNPTHFTSLCDSYFALTMGYTPLLIETANYELSGRVIIIDDDGGYGQ